MESCVDLWARPYKPVLLSKTETRLKYLVSNRCSWLSKSRNLARSLLYTNNVSKYQPERAWPRLIPKGSVMVSIYAPDGSQAYGVITNVSMGGAKIVAGVGFQADDSLLLRIGFDPDLPFSTSSRVIWSQDESDAKHRASFSHGVQFLISEPEQVERLRAILESPDFKQPVLPGQPAAASKGSSSG